MTTKEATQVIVDAWDITNDEARGLIEDFAINSGEVETVDQIGDVTKERVKEILEHLDNESETNAQIRRTK